MEIPKNAKYITVEDWDFCFPSELKCDLCGEELYHKPIFRVYYGAPKIKDCAFVLACLACTKPYIKLEAEKNGTNGGRDEKFCRN
jgi:hypothetical protein